MKSLLTLAAVSAALALAAPLAVANATTVLTFDDIVGSDDYSAVPANYGGLDWSASTWAVLTSAQVPYTPHSDAGRITLGWGSTDADSSIRFTTPAVFEGAWFAGYSEATVRFDLYSGGQLVASSTTLTLSATPTYLASGWTGAIDRVVVSSPLHAFYVMDDFAYAPVTDVPEPASWALLAAGGVFVVGLSRRRQRAGAAA